MLALMKAFHCCEPKERVSTCVPLIASLTTYEVYFGEDEEGEKEDEDEGTPGDKVSHFFWGGSARLAVSSMCI